MRYLLIIPAIFVGFWFGVLIIGMGGTEIIAILSSNDDIVLGPVLDVMAKIGGILGSVLAGGLVLILCLAWKRI